MVLKVELTEKYRLHQKDTGSAAFQIILLSEEIEKIKSHLFTTNEGKNKKDVPAKRALLKKIALRRRFYRYLVKNNPEIWQKLKSEPKDSTKFLGLK